MKEKEILYYLEDSKRLEDLSVEEINKWQSEWPNNKLLHLLLDKKKSLHHPSLFQPVSPIGLSIFQSGKQYFQQLVYPDVLLGDQKIKEQETEEDQEAIIPPTQLDNPVPDQEEEVQNDADLSLDNPVPDQEEEIQNDADLSLDNPEIDPDVDLDLDEPQITTGPISDDTLQELIAGEAHSKNEPEIEPVEPMLEIESADTEDHNDFEQHLVNMATDEESESSNDEKSKPTDLIPSDPQNENIKALPEDQSYEEYSSFANWLLSLESRNEEGITHQVHAQAKNKEKKKKKKKQKSKIEIVPIKIESPKKEKKEKKGKKSIKSDGNKEKKKVARTEKKKKKYKEKEKTPKNKKGKKKKGKSKQLEKLEKTAQNSVTYNENVVSESLALLLAKQNHKVRAIQMYHKLSLIFPEKSAFFAAQIEKLNKRRS